ncbi:zinc-finger homeodomain protein 4-like [Curcuma longa]|uniref:zinc-finger homeodomain protein 4-like n=1 Tax=Curcuma longa TaxID=136217 RepID=UPI003D9F2F7B
MNRSDPEGEIPIPITSTFVGGTSSPHGHEISLLHPTSKDFPPPPLSTASREDHHQHHNPEATTYSTKKGPLVKYGECLKNHAASIGGNATDGCGEFMPSGEEGTLEALKCSACHCHRNFHRKEVEGESSWDFFHPLNLQGRKPISNKGLLTPGAEPFGYNTTSNNLIARLPPQMIMPLGALQNSESDEMEARPPFMRKRFRTKFSNEQKEKMLQFSEKAGWRLQKQEESVVQQFCQDIGVKRNVLKVWMHNNKHNLAKKSSLQFE